MQCPRCDCEMPPDAEFCPECREKTIIVCTRCQTRNALAHKFCQECGQRLDMTKVGASTRFQSPESYTPKYLAERIRTSGLENERKLVTVLFADIKSSTEMIADRDPEDASRILDAVLQRMIEAVHRFEGRSAA